MRISIFFLEYIVGFRLIRWLFRLGELFVVEDFFVGKDVLLLLFKKVLYFRGGGLLYFFVLFRGGRGFIFEDVDSFFFIFLVLLEL